MTTTARSAGIASQPLGREVTRRLLGSSAIVSVTSDSQDIAVSLDAGSLVRRLLLFDTYILYSVRLKEIPGLVQHFGFQGTMDLLASGALEIRCECAQYSEGNFNTPPCPLMTFQFHVLDAHVWEQYLIDCLPELRKAVLTTRQRMDLESTVVKAVRRADNREMFTKDVAPSFEGEILSSSPLVKAAVRLVLFKEHGIPDAGDFRLAIHKVGDDRFEVDTDLDLRFAISKEQVHQDIKNALLGVAGLHQRVGEMKAHSAISGFTEEEIALFHCKFESLADAFGSNRNEKRFLRTISIAGLSEGLPPGQRIDVERLLKVRGEPEAAEFRAWLTDLDRLSDAEIKERIASLTTKLGLAVQTTTGKALRFLATTVAGILAPVGGVALGVADQFLWDKFLRRSGVAAFINELYPSIFTKR